MLRALVIAVFVASVLHVPSTLAASGIAARPSNPTCIAPPRPETASVSVAPAFLNIVRGDGLLLGRLPGDTSRVYMMDRDGVLWRFPNDAATSTKTMVLDLRPLFAGTTQEGQSGMMGMAFHPNFDQNGELYVSYTVPGVNRTSYVARYTSSDGGQTFATAGQILMSLPQEGNFHGVGQVMFGEDGFLYIGFGDGGFRELVQDLGTWYGKMLRIDVDQGALYGIPPDNPLADGGGAPEIYAVGLRNAWGFSQDEVTGEIWLGDVGSSSWEEVNKLVKGANYGWPITEGFHCFEAATCDRTGLTDPLYEYSHDDGCAIIGGHIYRGSLFPSLVGKFIFADYCSGDISSLEETAEGAVVKLLVNTSLSIGSIAETPTSELMLIGGGSQRIQMLVPAAGGGGDENFPALLSETGCVNPANPTEPAEGLIPYTVNTPLWSDAAEKRRWMAVPDGSQITVEEDGDFDFPIGSVLVKEFSFDDTPFETRLFVRHDDGGWAGYTYRWNDLLTDAELVPSAGLADQDIDGHAWSYPSRAQCLECHSVAAGRTLGLETAQLNGSFLYPSGILANQLETLSTIGMFANGLGGSPETLPALAPLDAVGRSLDDRARSYLHANCSNCHRPEGPGQGPMDFRYHLSFEQTSTCDVNPQVSDLGVPGAKILAPGNPGSSILSLRMHALDGNRMPPLASRVVDLQGTATVDDWISDLAGCTSVSNNGFVKVLSLSNVNSSGGLDLAVVRDGPIRAEIREGTDGALIRTLTFLSSASSPTAAAVLPDTDNDGVGEVAVLGVRTADQNTVVQIRSLDGSGAAREVPFAAGNTPIALAVIDGGSDSDGVHELAVLSTRNSDGRGVMEVRNAAGTPNPRSFLAPKGFVPNDLEIVPDADGNGVPDLALLATRASDDRIFVEVRDADGTGSTYRTGFGDGRTAIDLAVIPDKDADGIPELAVLSARITNGQLRVQVKNASGAFRPFSFTLGTTFTGIALAAVTPADGNPTPEVAVLRQRKSDGAIWVTVRNAVGNDPLRSIPYAAAGSPRGLAVFEDTDGNGIEEPAVLMIRNSDGRILVESRNSLGTPAPRTYIFEP